VGTEGEVVTEPLQFPRIPNANYINRPFIWYVNDCYNLVEDYYRFTLGITLPEKDITFDWSNVQNLSGAFDKYISDYNFTDIYKVEDIRKGDLILIDRNGMAASHLGIYEDGYILHQDSLSRRQPLSNFIGNIRRILRYAS
jgi:cell wall-associated NlpC family hydrolase